jgi:hypothetical protein
MKNKKAIAVYLDKNEKMIIEFSWLWKSWKHHELDKEYDLVVYHNREVEEDLKKFPGTRNIPMDPVRASNKYKFLNSHYFCLDEWSEPLKEYDYLMKTDCDVFLTQYLKGYTPSKIHIGLGGYYDSDDVRKIDFLRKVCQDYGLKYQHISNTGATFFGKSESVISLVKNQAIMTENILVKYIKDEECPYSGFKQGIASMIAGEVIVNGFLHRQLISLYQLDAKCWKTTPISNDVLHIHAWHSYDKWSKHDFFAGKYSDWVVKYEDRYNSAADFCHWIATNDIS